MVVVVLRGELIRVPKKGGNVWLVGWGDYHISPRFGLCNSATKPCQMHGAEKYMPRAVDTRVPHLKIRAKQSDTLKEVPAQFLFSFRRRSGTVATNQWTDA
jgi:hypothetical protein